MHLIASAFMRGAEAQDNAVATSHLIQAHRAYCPELCLGVYQGKREVSVKLSGFESQEHAQRIARSIIASFGQECVLLVTDCGAWVVTATDGQWLGDVIRVVHDPALVGHDSYTQFLDGTYMVALDNRAVVGVLAA